MKALIIRGKHTGKEVEVSQWCNDWFTLDPRKNEDMTEKEKEQMMVTPMSPTSLAFQIQDWNKIVAHKNNGTLFEEFEKKELNGKLGAFEYTFQRRKAPKEAPRRFITPEEAWALVDKSSKDECHVFHNAAFGLLGFDVSMERIKVALGQAKTIEIGGEACMAMQHGIVVIPKGAKLQSDIWFIKHDPKAMKKYL